VRLIREVVAGLKQRRRARHKAHILANRTILKVHRPGVVGVLDAAKMPDEKGGECIMYRDRGSLRVDVNESVNAATNANDTLGVLTELKSKGRLPLVAVTDNGSPFVAGAVEDFMADNNVIHLKSLPRVPQQNGSAESAVGEVKALVNEGVPRVQVCQILNDYRKRESLNWKTPADIERESSPTFIEELRIKFYNAAKTAIETAKLGTKTAYEKRKAEREAIFQTLESFSLVTRIRGHRLA
jgi:transposase InsO family protein